MNGDYLKSTKRKKNKSDLGSYGSSRPRPGFPRVTQKT